MGVLFSLFGLAMIEKSLSDATLMAIDEINAGGVNDDDQAYFRRWCVDPKLQRESK